MLANLNNYSVLELTGLTYLVLAIIKVILCLSNVRVAAAVLHRKMGNFPKPYYFVVATILVAAVVFFRVPVALWQEKLRFFLVYSDRKVMRDILSAF